MSLAWLHHKGRNRHHLNTGSTTVLPTTVRSTWRVQNAAQICSRNVLRPHCRLQGLSGDKYTDASAYDYYEKSRGHILIHPETGELIGKMLLVLKEQGEDAAFDYVRALLREEKQMSDKMRKLSEDRLQSCIFQSKLFSL